MVSYDLHEGPTCSIRLRYQMRVLITIIALTLAAGAQANAGTPLMWASMFYLVLGNLLIGALEGSILKRLLHGKLELQRVDLIHPETESLMRYGSGQGVAVRVSGTLILANYTSAIAGAYLLSSSQPMIDSLLGPRPLERVGLVLATLWCSAFLLSILIELPFVGLASRQKIFSLSNLKNTLIVNLLSYTLIGGWFWFASAKSLYQEVQVTHATEITSVTPAWIYYIDPKREQIRRIRGDGTLDELLRDKPLGEESKAWGTLLLRASKADPQKVDLWLTGFSESRNELIGESLFLRSQVAEPDLTATDRPAGINVSFLNEVVYRTGVWPYEGVTVRTGSMRYRIALETPALPWHARSSTTLPSGHGVVQLGPQVLLIDGQGRKLAFLAKGIGPVVVIDK